MPLALDRDVDVSAVLGRVRLRLADLAQPDALLAERTLARVQPPNWTLEWQLPRWLGVAFGLSPHISHEIVVSNVLGLAGVRLEDDLLDGEIGADERAAAVRVAPCLIDRAIEIYRTWFRPTSSFWRALSADMARWRACRTAGTLAPDGALDGFDRLADRAAPVLIGARAVALLSGHASDWPDLDRCLRHGTVALATLDDVTDWAEDLEAGRWNVFVASAAGGPQTRARRALNRTAVLISMLTAGSVGRTLARARDEADQAATLARRLGVEPLADHFGSMAARAEELGADADRHYGRLTARMTEALLDQRTRVDQAAAGGTR